MKKVKIWQGTTKGELIALACDNDKAKIANIDPSLPQEWVESNPGAMRYWYAMDYNPNPIFGEVRNIKNIAKDNDIEFVYS